MTYSFHDFVAIAVIWLCTLFMMSCHVIHFLDHLYYCFLLVFKISLALLLVLYYMKMNLYVFCMIVFFETLNYTH